MIYYERRNSGCGGCGCIIALLFWIVLFGLLIGNGG